MKTNELQFKLQAWLDGELTAAEVAQVEALLASHAEARALHAELKATRDALRGNEPQAALPVAHDFYFSQIQRAITQAEAAEPRKGTPATWAWLPTLRRALMPLSGFAAIAIIAVGIVKFAGDDPARHYVEIESVSEEVTTTSFRAQSENMFVVWVSNREVPEAEPMGYGEAAYQ